MIGGGEEGSDEGVIFHITIIRGRTSEACFMGVRESLASVVGSID